MPTKAPKARKPSKAKKTDKSKKIEIAGAGGDGKQRKQYA